MHLTHSTTSGGNELSPRRAKLTCPRITWPLAAAVLLALAATADAAVLYVDNQRGSDAFDGLASEPVDYTTGPVRTIRRALQVAHRADTIVLVNTGIPFYETVELTGPRFSGNSSLSFTIVGNGCVISGAQPVPQGAWQSVGPRLWKMTPWYKGHYQLIRGDRALAARPVTAGLFEPPLDGTNAREETTNQDIVAPRNADALPQLEPDTWCAWRGEIYYRSGIPTDANEQPLAIAVRSVGLTLYEVHDVLVRDVTFRHFRIDGINAHDRCRNVVLQNVQSLENGRAGVAVGGTSTVELRGCALEGNRRHSLFITELGGAELTETELSQPPQVEERQER